MSGCSLYVFCRAKTSIITCNGVVLQFYLISMKRNRKLDDIHLVQTKPKGKNTPSITDNEKNL